MATSAGAGDGAPRAKTTRSPKSARRMVISRVRAWLSTQAREDFFAQEPDGPQHPGLLHPRPLDADDDGGDAERVPVAGDLLSHPGGIAQEEAVAREGVEVGREALAGRERLVRLPLPVGLVLGPEEAPRLADGRRRIRRDVALLDERDLGRRRLSRGGARLPEQGELALQRRQRRVRVHQPRVAESRGPLDAGVRIGRQPDLRARPLERRHGDADVRKREMAAGIAQGLARPEPLDDLEPLDEATDPLLRILPHGLVLDVTVAEPHSEDEASATDHVERRDLLGDLDGMVQGEEQDSGPERHRAGFGRDPCEDGNRLEICEGGGEVVLAGPDGIEADSRCQADLLEVLLEAAGWRVFLARTRSTSSLLGL